jgi:hypothetical protein
VLLALRTLLNTFWDTNPHDKKLHGFNHRLQGSTAASYLRALRHPLFEVKLNALLEVVLAEAVPVEVEVALVEAEVAVLAQGNSKQDN